VIKKALLPCALLALSIALNSCVSFSNGVVDNPMPNDMRLIGYWELLDSKLKGTVLIEENTPGAINIIDFEDANCSKIERYGAVRTEIAGQNLLDITGVRPSGEPVKLSWISYDFPDPNRLAFSLPDSQLFEDAVASGALAGKITKSKNFEGKEYSNVEINASTAELRQWVANHPTAMHTRFLALERRDLQQVPQCWKDAK
jgi:hypothetical protein